MPDPLSYPMTGDPLEVSIAADPEGFVAATLSAYESDPDWNDPQGLVMDAPFQPSVNPLCLAVDGDRYPPGTTKESLNLNHIQYGNCDCFLLPYKWKYGVDRDPDGRIHEVKRPAIGDSGCEESISYRVTAEAWLRDNPKTAVAILGEEIADAFLGRCSDGRPLPPIPLKWAAERWAAAVRAEEDRQRAMADEMAMLRRKQREQRRREKELKQQVIGLEKEGCLRDALTLCSEALQAGWEGDWEHRMARLEKRLAKKQPEANH